MVKEKRGAVELSITTIVVVVIGITLLVLGLTFVYNIFTDIGAKQRSIAQFTDQKIREIFEESDQALNLPTDTFDIELGKVFNLDLVIKNIEEVSGDTACTYRLQLDAPDQNGVNPKNWFRYSIGDKGNGEADNIRVTPSAVVTVRAQIRPTKENAALGTYLMNLNLYNDDCITGTARNSPVDGGGNPLSITVR